MAIIKIKEVIKQEPAPQPKKTIHQAMKEKQAERKKYISDMRFSGKGF